jgi:hypothetical protein
MTTKTTMAPPTELERGRHGRTLAVTDYIDPPDYVYAAYQRITGRNFADLPPHIRQRFIFAPPDMDVSDIEFGLEGLPFTATRSDLN